MTLVQGCLALAVSNVILLAVLGLWNAQLHWTVGCLAMFFLVVSWVFFWAEDAGTNYQDEEIPTDVS